MKNIYLVGFMGSGKSVVGKLLAKKLGRKFLDLDSLIEHKVGKKISDIFSQDGEAFFRTLEKEVVRDVVRKQALVVACGGGVVADKENLDMLKKSGVVVCLTVRPEVVYKRCKDTCARPLLNVAEPQKDIERLLALRTPFYAQAHFSVDTSDITPEEAALEIIKKIETLDD